MRAAQPGVLGRVGATGTAPPGAAGVQRRRSVTPLRLTAPEFLDAVIQVLPSFRYHTATAGGCTVPAWVEQPFSFRVFE